MSVFISLYRISKCFGLSNTEYRFYLQNLLFFAVNELRIYFINSASTILNRCIICLKIILLPLSSRYCLICTGLNHHFAMHEKTV